jgi:hypothetical protein
MNPCIFIFGAGARKVCGGPLTNEILPDAFTAGASADPEANALRGKDFLPTLEEFLGSNFPC